MKNIKDNDTAEIEIGSGNIFADLALDDADELNTRTALGIQVLKNIRQKGLNQKEAGKVLGLKQPEVSAIMRENSAVLARNVLFDFSTGLSRKLRLGQPSSPRRTLSASDHSVNVAYS